MFSKFSINDDYINSRNANDKIQLFENENHIVAIASDGAIIYTKDGQKHLKEYKPAIKFINNHIVWKDDTTFYCVRFEARTEDYVTNINDVERFVKNLRLDRNIIQQYNKQRSKNQFSSKNENEEHYSVGFSSDYYTDMGFCSKKEVEFSTAEYYNNIIGRIGTIIAIKSLYTDSNSLSKMNFYDDIEKLKEKQFDMLIDCFNKEYLEKII